MTLVKIFEVSQQEFSQCPQSFCPGEADKVAAPRFVSRISADRDASSGFDSYRASRVPVEASLGAARALIWLFKEESEWILIEKCVL